MILIIQSLWNEAITQKLVTGAQKLLDSKKYKHKLIQVPGALEIPLAMQWALKKHKAKVLGVITCGTVVKGDTYHFELVANESSRQIADLSLKFNIPVGHGILATYDIDQALERAGGTKGNKGEEAAEAVVEMLELKKKI